MAPNSSATRTLCFGAKYCSFNQVCPLPCKIFAIAFNSNFVHLHDFTAFQFTVKAPTVWRRFGWKAIQIFRARLRELAKAVAVNIQVARYQIYNDKWHIIIYSWYDDIFRLKTRLELFLLKMAALGQDGVIEPECKSSRNATKGSKS